MNPELHDISKHIYSLGIGMLSQAQRNAFYTDHGYEIKLNEGTFSVIQAAQAAELLIKAAIAEQHPLLIFHSLPKSNTVDGDFLSINDLFESAKTIQYIDLPERLWATTGYKIRELEIYNKFGKLRNCIQHFAIPNVDPVLESSTFIYKVIDPTLEHFWNDYAVEHVDLYEYEDVFFDLLAARNLKVRYPDKLAIYAKTAYEKLSQIV